MANWNVSLWSKPYFRFFKTIFEKVKNITGETANLTIMDNYQIVYIAQEESDSLIKMFTKTGAVAPLHCTAAGKSC